MANNTFDAIIIGAGHNGLVAAAFLARAGYRVKVVERNEIIGGASTSESILPGYWVDTGSFDASLFSKQIVTEFGLSKHDLRFIESPVLSFIPQVDNLALTLWRDQFRNQEEIARFSKLDSEKFGRFQEEISRIGAILKTILQLPPPPIKDFHLNELTPWMRVAMDIKRLGKSEMMDLIRILPMPISDFLNEWFESPLLKGYLGSLGVAGLMQGPSAPGTTLMFLYNTLGTQSGQYLPSVFVRGGMSNLVNALRSEAQSRGAEITTGVSVKKILIEGNRAVGIQLEDGTILKGTAILSNANPDHTYMELVGSNHLQVDFVRELKNIRYRGSVARIIFGLTDLPRFRSAIFRESDLKEGTLLSGHIVISPDLDYIERAFDDAKYGNPSSRPVLDIAIPTILDPSRAPKGKHLMLVNAIYAPYRLTFGSWETQKVDFINEIVGVLENYAPGFRQRIEAQTIITPADMESRFGLPEGCIHHGQMVLDQLLFMRPVPGFSNYRTPIKGLYLCGAGTHPGGGVTGLPGYNAAKITSRDLTSSNFRK